MTMRSFGKVYSFLQSASSHWLITLIGPNSVPSLSYCSVLIPFLNGEVIDGFSTRSLISTQTLSSDHSTALANMFD